LRNGQLLYLFFKVVLLQILLGSGAAWIRIRNDLSGFRIMLKISDLTGSGYTFHNTAYRYLGSCGGSRKLMDRESRGVDLYSISV
jgi:hypothetical protein